MTRTIGPDNAIAWVQVRLRGGARNLLTTTGAYAGVIALSMTASVQLLPSPPSQVLGGWATGLMVLQAAVLLLFGASRVAAAIRQDITSGIIESHRLMPVAPGQAVAGYMLGATSQAMCLAAANLLLGGYAAVSSGVRWEHWLGANALLMAFAAFIWAVLAFAAFHPRNPIGLAFVIPVAMSVNQGGALSLAPGLVLLAAPLLGNSVFDLTATLGGLTPTYVLSLMAQFVVGAICFTAAARKYRRPDVIGLTPVLAMMLLAVWVGISWLGITQWEALRPRYVRGEWLTPGAQFVTSLFVAMLLALVPVTAAAELNVAWTRRRLLSDPGLGRRPLPDLAVVFLATGVVMLLCDARSMLEGPIPTRAMPAAQLGTGADPGGAFPPSALAFTTAAVLLHLLSASYLRRAMRYYTEKVNGPLFLWLMLTWLGPLLADAVRHHRLERPDLPVFSEISTLSPLGTVIAIWGRRDYPVTTGLMFQAVLTACMFTLHHLSHPERRRLARARAKRDPVAAPAP